MAFLALVDAPLSSESMKFPVFSLLAGNLGSQETGSLETASSSGESIANLKESVSVCPSRAVPVGEWEPSQSREEAV
jgi:hypothetical protein